MPRDSSLARIAPEVLPERPWERLDYEPTKAYAWFMRYREMDATVRSIARLADEHGKSKNSGGQLRTWSVRWKWVERAKAWDEFLEQQAVEAQIDAIRKAGATRAMIVMDGLELLHARLVGREGLVDEETGEVMREPVRAIDPDMLDMKDLAALGGMLSKMHALADEAAGVKPLDEQRVEVKLSFGLGAPEQHPVVEGRVIHELTAPQPSLPEATTGSGDPPDPEPEGT